MIKHKTKKNRGFIALMSAVIISIILLLIAVNLSQTSFYGRFNILDSELKEKSSALAEDCADTAILKLANDPSYSPPTNEIVPVGGDNCTIESVLGGLIKIKADYKNYITRLEVTVNTTTLAVTRWEEI